MPATIGVAPLVPCQKRWPPPGIAPISASLGAITPIVMPWEDASPLARPKRSTPPTVSTPGIVAGADTCSVPLPRLPAAAITIRSG